MAEVSTQQMAMGLGVVGALGLALLGVIKITTPDEAQCQVDLSAAKARLDLLQEVKETCKTALTACAATHPETP